MLKKSPLDGRFKTPFVPHTLLAYFIEKARKKSINLARTDTSTIPMFTMRPTLN
jgi:hypothetical protein